MLGKFWQITRAVSMHSLPTCHTALSVSAAFNFQLLRVNGVESVVLERHEDADQRIS